MSKIYLIEKFVELIETERKDYKSSIEINGNKITLDTSSNENEKNGNLKRKLHKFLDHKSTSETISLFDEDLFSHRNTMLVMLNSYLEKLSVRINLEINESFYAHIYINTDPFVYVSLFMKEIADIELDPYSSFNKARLYANNHQEFVETIVNNIKKGKEIVIDLCTIPSEIYTYCAEAKTRYLKILEASKTIKHLIITKPKDIVFVDDVIKDYENFGYMAIMRA